MIEILSILLYLIQGAAFIAAILYYNKYKLTNQKYFLYLLGYNLVNIIIAHFIGSANYYVFNIYMVVSFLFYFYWFYTILKEKLVIKISVILFILSTTYAVIYESFWNSLWRKPFIAGTIIIIILATLFFRNLLTKSEVINFNKSQQFWIVTGLLMFYLGFLPILLFWNMINIAGFQIRIMITLLNIILYGCFIKSFLCLKK